MIRYCIERGITFGDPLKKTGYMSLQLGRLRFKDILNFTAPVRLDKYLRQWEAKQSKLIWPYGHFHSIEEVRKTTEFPAYEAFYSELKRSNIAEEAYQECKELYMERKSLPEGHPEKMHNMSCWLRLYNLIDVKPFVTAIENMVSSYSKNFDCDPHIKFSLPSLAFDSVCHMSDKTSPLVYTFSSEEQHQKFKKNILGGCSNVYHKLIALGQGDDWPERALYAPNGDRFTSVVFVDINAM